jgi:hypothetical protein
MTIVADKDLRSMFGPVRDQDPRPTCMAFAASDIHAAVRPGWTPLSVEWAYYHALKREGGVPHRGVGFDTMLAVLEEDGQPVETAWPYIDHLFTDIDAWTPPAAASLFKRCSAPFPATCGDVITELDSGRPVLLTMSLSQGFFLPDSAGVISGIEPLDTPIHALVAVGHGHRGADRFVLVRNSWGAGWGIDGHGWVDTAYLAPRLLATAIMTGEN